MIICKFNGNFHEHISSTRQYGLEESFKFWTIKVVLWIKWFTRYIVNLLFWGNNVGFAKLRGVLQYIIHWCLSWSNICYQQQRHQNRKYNHQVWGTITDISGEDIKVLNEIMVIKTEVTLEMIITYHTPMGTVAYLAAGRWTTQTLLIHLRISDACNPFIDGSLWNYSTRTLKFVGLKEIKSKVALQWNLLSILIILTVDGKSSRK